MKQNLFSDRSRYLYRFSASLWMILVTFMGMFYLLLAQNYVLLVIYALFLLLNLWWMLGTTPIILQLTYYMILWKFMFGDPLMALAMYLPVLATHHDKFSVLYLTQGEANYKRLIPFRNGILILWPLLYAYGIFQWAWRPYYLCLWPLLLVPEKFWEARSRWWQLRKQSLTIYYDGECGFCQRGCQLLCHLFLPDWVEMKPCQSDPVVLDVMERENSWVVKSESQSTLLVKNQAIVEVFKHSLILYPLGVILSLPAISWLMNTFYHWLSNNRKSGANFLFYVIELSTRR
jgi:predicted DCC family thiol-disulfide oxidoreductase YuxK